ncbi:MAG: VOC family protein [Acidimicrobiales bacterium]
MAPTPVDPDRFAQLEGLEDWRYHLGAIHSDFRAGSFPAAANLAERIADAAEQAVHHPDITILYPDRVRVTLTTHEIGGLSELDVDLAREVSRLSSAAGATCEPTASQSIEVTIDVTDIEACAPFWAAVMGGYRRVGDRLLVDPLRSGPTIFFQKMDVPRPQRSRMHIDVSVPHDTAEARVAAAIEAGGRLLDDSHARAFWVLADPEGNEACVCTWQDRN